MQFLVNRQHDFNQNPGLITDVAKLVLAGVPHIYELLPAKAFSPAEQFVRFLETVNSEDVQRLRYTTERPEFDENGAPKAFNQADFIVAHGWLEGRKQWEEAASWTERPEDVVEQEERVAGVGEDDGEDGEDQGDGEEEEDSSSSTTTSVEDDGDWEDEYVARGPGVPPALDH